MTKRTKALNIRALVRKRVHARDGGACVLCGRPYDLQCAHYIGRGQSGLGVEENLVTLCTDCHRAYDQGQERADLRARIGDYLRSFYPDWDESGLVYEKWACFAG